MLWAGCGTWNGGRCRALLLLAVTAVGVACDEDPFMPPPPGPPTVRGVVWGDPAAHYPVSGVVMRIGDAVDTTDADGVFELTDLPLGPATVYGAAPGFEAYEGRISVPGEGALYHPVTLVWSEVYETREEFSAYVPDRWAHHAIVLALGGPDTRGFAAGTPFGAPVPEVEASLQALGESLRTLASNRGVAVLGTSLAAMPDGPESDELLLEAIAELAATTGLPELTSAPLLLYGMSGGAPQVSGFAARNPDRVAGLFFKVPAGVESLTAGQVADIPSYFVQAEMDAFVDNEAAADVYRDHRAVGAPWALALEPDVPHHSLSPRQRDLTIHWMSTILELRLPAESGGTLQATVESSGWLGDPVTLEASPFDEYAGDPGEASWFPNQATAEEWELFVRGGASQQ